MENKEAPKGRERISNDNRRTTLTFNQFQDIAEQLNSAYKNYLDAKMIVYWYRYFYDNDYTSLEHRIEKWIKANKTPPTIADLLL